MFNVVKASTWQPVQSFDDVNEAEAEACVCSGFAPDTIYAVEQPAAESATRVFSLWLNGFPFRADKSFSTGDLDTQPVETIDDGADTIVTRPQPVCERCGGLMTAIEAVEDEGPDGDELEMWQCGACGSIEMGNYAELFFGE